MTSPFKATEIRLLDRASDLLARAKRAGAESADAVVFESASLNASYRMGKREDLVRAEAREFGLRVFIGKRQGIVSSSDESAAALDELAGRAAAMAKAAPEDPYCGLADAADLAATVPDLDLVDATEPAGDHLFAQAAAAEDAARAVPGISNSEGAGAAWSRSSMALATSTGFAGTYSSSHFSVSVAVIAGSGTAMERDYEYGSARHLADLPAPADIGHLAAERTIRRLHPQKAATAKVAVVFEPRVATSFLGHLSGAISGPAVARGTSFLRDKMATAVFAPGIAIIDEPHRRRGLRSRPVDGEGVAPRRREVIADGVLTTWLLDSASARQLKLKTTGHASRGTSGPPGPATSNFYLAAGPQTPAALMRDIKAGLYVTDLIGFGVNGVTGDYSRGAAGFWIENGELAYPVSEITIAGNLKDMFKALTPADDLVFRWGVDAPTIRIDGMTVAGR
jgi:PmbA protein